MTLSERVIYNQRAVDFNTSRWTPARGEKVRMLSREEMIAKFPSGGVDPGTFSPKWGWNENLSHMLGNEFYVFSFRSDSGEIKVSYYSKFAGFRVLRTNWTIHKSWFIPAYIDSFRAFVKYAYTRMTEEVPQGGADER